MSFSKHPIAPKQAVYALNREFQIPVGPSLLGRLVNGFGRAHDGGPELHESTWRRVHAEAPTPIERVPIQMTAWETNKKYLKTKREKMGHLLENL